jgi:uncharacterized cupredoxin-like copper-binding protein
LESAGFAFRRRYFDAHFAVANSIAQAATLARCMAVGDPNHRVLFAKIIYLSTSPIQLGDKAL